ncbi:hypothetical protein ACFVH0_01200 [Streptomyces sp. NPDC127117]
MPDPEHPDSDAHHVDIAGARSEKGMEFAPARMLSGPVPVGVR